MEREPVDWLPRAVRRRTNLVGNMSWPDGTTARALVSNISYEGCQVWSDHELYQGETFSLALPGYGNIEAQIRWAAEGTAGVRFLLGAAADERRARIGV